MYDKSGYTQGLEITVQNSNPSSKRQLLFGIRGSNNSMIWFKGTEGDAALNSVYVFDVSYDASTKTIKVLVKVGSVTKINVTQTIDPLNYDYYTRMCLTGDPQWENGSCTCVFTNFKIEQLG